MISLKIDLATYNSKVYQSQKIEKGQHELPQNCLHLMLGNNYFAHLQRYFSKFYQASCNIN